MLKIIILLLALTSVIKAYRMFRNRSLGILGIIFLGIFWITLTILVFDLNISNQIASLLGMGRGADSMFFIAIIMLFIAFFKLYQKIDKLDQDLSKLTSETSKMFHKINLKK